VEFSELNIQTPLKNALQDLEFEYLTPIQEQSFPVILSGKNLVGIAQTGTGKTIAYLLPLLKQLKYSEQKHPRILILVPTRELVLQVVKEIEKLTKYMTVRYAGVYGGTNINTQKQVVYQGLDILVATPGRLYDLFVAGIVRFKSIQKLVIDEVDEMLNLGFRPQLVNILENLPERRQNLLFSATLTPEVEHIVNDFFFDAQKIEIAPHGTPLDKITQIAYSVPNFFTKLNLLKYLLETNDELKKVLIFVGTKKLADKVAEELSKKFKDNVGVIHSNKSQNYRINVLAKFEKEEYRILIATDVLARGLDITDVSHVINFDIQEAPEEYIHRIGRTGRSDKDGVAISFVNEKEQEYWQEIEKMMKKQVPLQILPEDVEVSHIFTDDERPSLSDKNYLPGNKNVLKGGGAFHQKSEKRMKQNSGGTFKKKMKSKNKKSAKRSGRKK